MNTELLKKDISESGLKVRSIAERMNISYQALYNKINGVTEFTVSEIKDYCRIRGKTVDELSPIFFSQNVD